MWDENECILCVLYIYSDYYPNVLNSCLAVSELGEAKISLSFFLPLPLVNRHHFILCVAVGMR